MSKPRGLGDEIKKLKDQGMSYREIEKLLDCSKGTIAYHLGKGQKEKSLKRQKKKRIIDHPYQRKLETYFYDKISNFKPKQIKDSTKKLLYQKIRRFITQETKNGRVYMIATFTIEDVINKFGENPKCYLTGEKIDINQPRTYNFDHKIPKSRGGDNSLDNLELATKRANLSKTDMTPDEFFAFCKQVLEYQGYEVKKVK